jgi:hypothetical protein
MKRVIGCIPVKLTTHPKFAHIPVPTGGYSTVPCPRCGDDVLLGERSKALMEREPTVQVRCLLCVLEEDGFPQRIERLDENDH